MIRPPPRSPLFPSPPLFRPPADPVRNRAIKPGGQQALRENEPALEPRDQTGVLSASNGLTLTAQVVGDRKSTRLNSSHSQISYAVFCLKKKNERIYHGRGQA